MEQLTVGDAAAQTGWSARMLRYLEDHGLVMPARTAAGYRLYGLAELNQLQLAPPAARALRASSSTSSPSRRACAATPSSARAVDTWLATERAQRSTGSTGSSASTSGCSPRDRLTLNPPRGSGDD